MRNVRHAIVEHLTLVADPELQLAYERDVPIADVPAELVCGWFDDSYLPSSPVVIAAFSEVEQGALADFSAVFESVLDHLPTEPHRRLHAWHRSTEWGEVVRAARLALANLERREQRG